MKDAVVKIVETKDKSNIEVLKNINEVTAKYHYLNIDRPN